MMKTFYRALLLAAAAGVVPACHDDDDDCPAAPAMSFVQVERLGRPAINEGLFITNDFLNAVNSITPAQDVGALTGAVLAEAAATLAAFDGLGGAVVNANDVVAALIPDVMRIDTTIASPVGTGAYANSAVAFGTMVRPVAGRKLEDDVIDITLIVLSGVGAASDGVSYAGQAGNEAQPGHQLLNGQSAPGGSATFPFLAAPN